MEGYKRGAERMKALQRLPEQTPPPVSPGLHPSSRGQVQAEYHRPPELTHTLVQRHFFPAEGAVSEGVGEPLPVADGESAEAAARRVSEYQRLVQRRAAQTSAAIRAETDAKLKLAQAGRERLQAAKEYGVRVAVGNARVLLRGQDAGADGARQGDGAADAGSAAADADGALPSPGPTPPPPVPKDLARVDLVRLEREHVPTRPPPPPPPPPAPPAPAEPQPAEPPAPSPPVRKTPASAAARHRLLAHCPAAAAEAAAALRAGLGEEQPPLAAAAPAVGASPSARQPAGYVQRVLQPANAAARTPAPNAVGKIFRGRPLPLAVSARDQMGVTRIAQRAAEMGAKLPPLCACPHAGCPFDTAYVSKCARNCSLYEQPKQWETLLTALLKKADVI